MKTIWTNAIKINSKRKKTAEQLIRFRDENDTTEEHYEDYKANYVQRIKTRIDIKELQYYANLGKVIPHKKFMN